MEKITKEELRKMACLSLEDLEKVSGGVDECDSKCHDEFLACVHSCGAGDLHQCICECEEKFNECLHSCGH